MKMKKFEIIYQRKETDNRFYKRRGKKLDTYIEIIEARNYKEAREKVRELHGYQVQGLIINEKS